MKTVMSEPLAGKPEKPAALTDWAYAMIKEDILNLRAQPGSQLHIEKLSKQMEISRTPIREALLRLQNDGLVQVFPRVGAFVADLTPQDLHELLEVREWLESNATKKVASIITESDLSALDELMANTELAVKNNDQTQFLEFEEAFHNMIIRLCGNKRLLGVMESLYSLIRRERVLSVRSPENIKWSLIEHQRVVAALHERNAERASAMMVEHIRAARARLCSCIEPQGNAAKKENKP